MKKIFFCLLLITPSTAFATGFTFFSSSITPSGSVTGVPERVLIEEKIENDVTITSTSLTATFDFSLYPAYDVEFQLNASTGTAARKLENLDMMTDMPYWVLLMNNTDINQWALGGVYSFDDPVSYLVAYTGLFTYHEWKAFGMHIYNTEAIFYAADWLNPPTFYATAQRSDAEVAQNQSDTGSVVIKCVRADDPLTARPMLVSYELRLYGVNK